MTALTPTVSMSDMFGTVPLSPSLYMRACVGVVGGMGVMWGFTRSGVSVSAPVCGCQYGCQIPRIRVSGPQQLSRHRIIRAFTATTNR